MSIIFRDSRLSQLREEVDQLTELLADVEDVKQDISDLQGEQVLQNAELLDHETRISDLEGTNPEALSGLTDVNVGILSGGEVLTWDTGLNKWTNEEIPV